MNSPLILVAPRAYFHILTRTNKNTSQEHHISIFIIHKKSAELLFYAAPPLAQGSTPLTQFRTGLKTTCLNRCRTNRPLDRLSDFRSTRSLCSSVSDALDDPRDFALHSAVFYHVARDYYVGAR